MSGEHPIRRLAVHVYESADAPASRRFLAMFSSPAKWPIHFAAATEAEARDAAEAFRAKTIRENEAAYAARVEALTKARAARAKKAAEAPND